MRLSLKNYNFEKSDTIPQRIASTFKRTKRNIKIHPIFGYETSKTDQNQRRTSLYDCLRMKFDFIAFGEKKLFFKEMKRGIEKAIEKVIVVVYDPSPTSWQCSDTS